MANYDRMNDFIKVENGKYVFPSVSFEATPTPTLTPTHKDTQTRCTCVPSGRCHRNTLLGCPHNHYFNDKNVWTCIKDK
jgi:hypothetical protein